MTDVYDRSGLVLILIIIIILAVMYIGTQPSVCHVDYEKLDVVMGEPIPYVPDSMTVGEIRARYRTFNDSGLVKPLVDRTIDDIISCGE